jgi:hypothetical protein
MTNQIHDPADSTVGSQPEVFGAFVPFHTPGLYFAENDDLNGQLFEANLASGVMIAKSDLRHAELGLADYFAGAAAQLRAESEGRIARAGSRIDATPELFVSLEQRYAIQAFELRERNGWISLEAYASEPEIRLQAAQQPYATTAELTLLARDEDGEVRAAALASLDGRAE